MVVGFSIKFTDHSLSLRIIVGRDQVHGQNKFTHSCHWWLAGKVRLELTTPRLTVVCSNQLSYIPKKHIEKSRENRQTTFTALSAHGLPCLGGFPPLYSVKLI